MKTARMSILAVVALALVVGAAGQAPASVGILYYNDYVRGTDRMAEALGGLGAGYDVTTVSSSADFKTQIETGNYELGILFVQYSWPSTYLDGISALGTFVGNGGRAIYTDWTRDSALSLANFGVGFTGSSNLSVMTVTMPELAFGLTNPVNLSNPGWTIYTMGLDESGVTAATFENDEGAIGIGKDGRAIVNGFLSDTFVDGVSGVQLYENEIYTVLGAQPVVPEPGSILVWSLLTIVGIAVGSWRCRKAV